MSGSSKTERIVLVAHVGSALPAPTSCRLVIIFENPAMTKIIEETKLLDLAREYKLCTKVKRTVCQGGCQVKLSKPLTRFCPTALFIIARRIAPSVIQIL